MDFKACFKVLKTTTACSHSSAGYIWPCNRQVAEPTSADAACARPFGEGEVVRKPNAIIDILSKIQFELTTLNDAARHDFAHKVEYLEQMFERHENHKDRAMELASQMHALMNHIKQ